MIVLRAPAKINWFLSVLGKRSDGYHDIDSVMQCVDLYDVLSFEKSDVIEVVSELDIEMTENLSYKAACVLKEASGYRGGARITLKKNIPLSAGLGGGSSDAAYTLVGLNNLWETGLSENELIDLGSRIGSDVPFFLCGPLVRVQGRGEVVTKMKTWISHDILLVKPDLSVSTAWAYSAYRPKLTNRFVDIRLFCRALEQKDYGDLGSFMVNDLEEPVMGTYEVLEEMKRTLKENGAQAALMSGSGSVVFGVFRSADEAERAVRSFGKCWHRVVKTLCEI